MVDDFTGDQAAHRGADALAGGDSPLSQVVMAGAAHEVRQHKWRERSVDARTHAIHQLNGNEPSAVIGESVEECANRQDGEADKEQWFAAPGVGLVADEKRYR